MLRLKLLGFQGSKSLEEKLKWPTHGCPPWRKNKNDLSMVAPLEDE